LGIVTVAPPMAAGELNRPLVGQSEKVILALASRCHRIPYAMCCLLIDEIDSLAPKRNEHSSEGKVDKMSILLSIIDGIKDVPNLMIFCSTNRLDMIDDAFLRRMSGKFFIGRPSSQARTQILAQIPIWVLERDLIERLAIASTNFSGAACK
jgi:SpoVK/Ycf46/Vps4 family AAA+-type ATPase